MVRKWVVSTDSIEWIVTMLGWLMAALEPLWIVGHFGRQQLERDLAAELRVLGPVDHSHAALAEHASDFVPG
jgi:hypothetical protein